ncbi:MAG: hypothetical protein LBN43_04375 [Oscillospiraceae bacterium]|jgi:hypothetical protein|nr:hypothetical protein [Oscillospiraceae bacterium]
MKEKFERLEHWMTNVFWYHYKWYWLLGVAAVTFGILLVADNIRAVSYDWKIAIINSYEMPYVKSGETPDIPLTHADVEPYFAGVLPDRNDDGTVRVRVYQVFLEPDKSGWEPMFTALNDSETYIITASEDVLKRLNKLGYLQRLNDGEYWHYLSGVSGVDSPGLPFAVTSGIVELTNPEQAAAIGMSEQQIADYDERLVQQHAEKLELAIQYVSEIG